MHKKLKLVKESTDVEEYWDATEIDGRAFMNLMKFNFGTDSKGNNYIVTNDAYEIGRFRADSDEEAKKKFREEFLKESVLTEDIEDNKEKEEEIEQTEEELEDTLDSEENQEENPVEEESELDKQLDDLRKVLVDLNLNLYQVTSKEDPNNSIYIIGKVAEDNNDTLMLIDTKPEEHEEVQIEDEPIETEIEDKEPDLKESDSNRLTWEEFEKIMEDACAEGKDIKGVIVFKPESFDKEYSEKSRSYEVSSDNKYWNPEKTGNSLFGYCLDGTDQGARLDWYMHSIPKDNLGKRWEVDYCYLQDTINESEENDVIEPDEKEEPVEDKSEASEERFDFVVLPKTFAEINELNPRYGEDLTPDHEAIMDYLMNCLIEIDPEAAEEIQDELAGDNLETAEELPLPADIENPEEEEDII